MCPPPKKKEKNGKVVNLVGMWFYFNGFKEKILKLLVLHEEINQLAKIQKDKEIKIKK